MSTGHSDDNLFLTAPVHKIFAATALPMAAIMLMNGLLGIVDAAFLGRFVGTKAMAAVGIAFPVLMLTISLSTLVSAGMSSLLARQLGASARDAAAATFAAAHGLALLIAAMLILIFMVGGWSFALRTAGSDRSVAEMLWVFLAISIFGTSVQFLLGIHADAWRNEGKAGLMALLSLGVTLANIALNYILIVPLKLGIAGSALGTILAQAIGLALLVGLRPFVDGMMPLGSLWQNRWTGGWRRLLALGAPVSLGFIGIALSGAVVLLALRLGDGANYEKSIAAYGIVTRVFGFTFLPIMAIAMAMQSIVGNNVGARLYARSDNVLGIAVATALVYCFAVEFCLLLAGSSIGALFVSNPDVVAQTGRLFRPMAALYLVSGPVFVFGLYFQAVGQPALAGLLTVAKPFVLLPLLIAALAVSGGADLIWFAYPLADSLAAIVAVLVLSSAFKTRRRAGAIGLEGMERAS
ncbi:MATE family efflux transporter [Rhizobium sp. B230/85]|uniref:MATE family efflux transporter n=1 Tax=unclassified Rhizobium TaxID=2613769 RepID=UPI001ADD30C7|nr:MULTISPECIES: MATE family efflux transporter [unclassified Rhizobium]MBO9133913.1 MATE family efflux transporter [Rhizobium sp. B209b/85]QXZ96947.1 MATE family efflux transporter [Rhizobium sp. B230/85]